MFRGITDRAMHQEFKHNFLKEIAAILIVFLASISVCSTVVYATDDVETAYEQMVTRRQNSTGRMATQKGQSVYEPLKELVLIDKETPYDAEMILLRGTAVKRSRFPNGDVEFEVENAFKIWEAERLLDVIQQELAPELGNNPSQKKILRHIRRYLKKTFKYDSEGVRGDGEEENFVDAYYGERKIVCSQYAALVYLLCDRYDIDCKICYGKKHVYNAIRFDGRKDYCIYDFTGTRGIVGAKVSHIEALSSQKYQPDPENEFSRVIRTALNDRINPHASWGTVDLLVCLIVILFIFLSYITVKMSR